MATLHLVLIYSVPVVIALATLEALIRSSRKRGAYDCRAYFASLTDLLVRQYLVYTLLPLGLADPVIGWAWTQSYRNPDDDIFRDPECRGRSDLALISLSG